MPAESFTFPVTAGWIRSVSRVPSPDEPWPTVQVDDELLEDHIRMLDAQKQTGVTYNRPWGLFIGRRWPVPFENVVTPQRAAWVKALVKAAHDRGVKILAGTGIYSWGFEEVIAKCPGVAPGRPEDGRNPQAMCAFSDEAWDWQRRVLDFQMDPQWDMDGVSMQSADQGRCRCDRCRKLSDVEHHAMLLIRSAEYIRAQRPDWIIGQASWGLRVGDPANLPHIQAISQAVDYILEVIERSARAIDTEQEVRGPWRKQLIASLSCAFGSVGGVFVGNPQHWRRLRWFLPCGLRNAAALKALHADGGRACEHHYRAFANPVDEVSWRVGARVMINPELDAQVALCHAVEQVYHTRGDVTRQLAELLRRGEDAYFTRSDFRVGDGELSLEPLVWAENPAAPGPAIYLRDRMTPAARADYAHELRRIRADLADLKLPDPRRHADTLTCIDGALADIAALV